MNRDEKAAVIDDIAAQIEGSEAIFAIDYRGISVPQAAALRTDLRDADASFRIVKNRLTKLAAERAGHEELKELLEGPTALAFIRGDTATAAKAISTFNREHQVLTFKGGFMDGLALDQDTFTSIARLPSRDVLNGQFAGVVASPLTGLVRGLGSMVSGLAIALQQIAEQGLVSGEPEEEAPAKEPPAEEPAADDAPVEEPEAEQQQPQPDANPDTPGSEAEDVSGSDAEEVSGSSAEDVSGSDSEPTSTPPAEAESESAETEEPQPDEAAAPEAASDPAAEAETSDEPETSNEEE